ADAAHARARAAACTLAHSHGDVVARAEPKQRGGPMPQMGQHQLARCAVLERERLARAPVDQLWGDETAGAEMHAVLLLALAPERDADVADAHRLHPSCAPATLEQLTKCGLPPARLAGHEHTLHAGRGEVEAAGLGRLDQVGRI